MYASGASGLIDGLYGDGVDDAEAIINQPVYLGGSFVSSDDTLFRRLYDRLFPRMSELFGWSMFNGGVPLRLTVCSTKSSTSVTISAHAP